MYSSDEYAGIVIFHFYSDYWNLVFCVSCNTWWGLFLFSIFAKSLSSKSAASGVGEGSSDLYTIQAESLLVGNVGDAGKTPTWQPRTIRSSANAKSTARASCLVGVLYDISRGKISWWLINHFYVIGPKSYRIPRNNANYTAITPFKVIHGHRFW